MTIRNILKVIAFFAVGMIGGIFADQILWPYFVEKPLFSQYSLEKALVSIIEKKETVIQENTALTEAIEKEENTIMAVRSQTASGTIEGSGLIVTSDGLTVTLAELVPQGSVFSFFINGKAAPFQILKRDLNKNLALIKLGESNLPMVEFADFSAIKLGERVFLIGEVINKKETSKLVNEGIVRKFDKSSIETNMSEKNILKGSPLFNIKGEVLGINTINSEGRVISIPISIIKEFIGL
ncbi:MAG: serine protease [Candidatus Nealsonbacteria bacterium]|nr:serine protease [Candidatus Nealsonbacteria bacterium]